MTTGRPTLTTKRRGRVLPCVHGQIKEGTRLRSSMVHPTRQPAAGIVSGVTGNGLAARACRTDPYRAGRRQFENGTATERSKHMEN